MESAETMNWQELCSQNEFVKEFGKISPFKILSIADLISNCLKDFGTRIQLLATALALYKGKCSPFSDPLSFSIWLWKTHIGKKDNFISIENSKVQIELQIKTNEILHQATE